MAVPAIGGIGDLDISRILGLREADARCCSKLRLDCAKCEAFVFELIKVPVH